MFRRHCWTDVHESIYRYSCLILHYNMWLTCCYSVLTDMVYCVQCAWTKWFVAKMVFDFPFSDLTLLLGDRKGVLPIKKFMLIFEWWWSDWSFARLGLPIYTTAISRACERSGQKSGEREWSGERTFHVSRKRLSGSGEWSGRPRSRERMSQTKIGLSAERQIGRSCSAHMLWPLPASHTPLKSTTVCYSGTGLSRLSWKSGR